VQVGSFRDEAQAVALKRDLESDGHAPVRVVPFDVEGIVYYRVQVGVFVDREQAERLAVGLGRNGVSGFVMQVSAALDK
jgi:cell division protein FtsN